MDENQVPHYQILMIDDDVDLTELVREYLERFGHHLRSAHTANEGLKVLRRQASDLIILDIMLPDTDGLTLCREIRKEFDTPIIMLTARGELADRVMGLELGADDLDVLLTVLAEENFGSSALFAADDAEKTDQLARIGVLDLKNARHERLDQALLIRPQHRDDSVVRAHVDLLVLVQIVV